MPNDSISLDVKCPFYVGNAPCRITCQWTRKRKITQSFQRKADMLLHVKKYCSDNWEKCEFAKILLAIYAKRQGNMDVGLERQKALRRITIAAAAKRWGISVERIRQLCRDKRIPDAQKEVINGRSTWTISEQDKPQGIKPGRKGYKK